MYGILNRAIEELVTAHFGTAKWALVKERSGVDVDYFISNEPYDDDITYRLATAVSEEMNMPVGEVFRAFGEWWVVKTAHGKYGALMTAGGKSLREFLINLPHFHNRIYLIYPKVTPPEFQISDLSENSLHLHYRSSREGLQDFVLGLLQGLVVMFDTPADIGLIADRNAGDDHDIFKICWT